MKRIYVKTDPDCTELARFHGRNALKEAGLSEFLVKKAIAQGHLYDGGNWVEHTPTIHNSDGWEFHSLNEVKAAGFCLRAVRDCLAGKQQTADGLAWSYDSRPPPPGPRRPQNRRHRFEVVGYPIDGSEPVRFSVRSEVLTHPMGYRTTGIDACLHGRTKRYKDCIWKYPNDPAPTAEELATVAASLPPPQRIRTSLGEEFDSLWAAARLGFDSRDVLESIATGVVRHDRVWSYM